MYNLAFKDLQLHHLQISLCLVLDVRFAKFPNMKGIHWTDCTVLCSIIEDLREECKVEESGRGGDIILSVWSILYFGVNGFPSINDQI